jgi:hypothetical protein
VRRAGAGARRRAGGAPRLAAPVDADAPAVRRVERRVLEATRGVGTVRRRPGRQLLVAAAIGLLAGGLLLFVNREERRKEDQRRCEVLVRCLLASEEAALDPTQGAK